MEREGRYAPLSFVAVAMPGKRLVIRQAPLTVEEDLR